MPDNLLPALFCSGFGKDYIPPGSGKGKSNPKMLEEINKNVRDLFKSNSGRQLTTTAIAEELGMDPSQVTTHLNRILINLNGRAAITLLPDRAPGNERVWALKSRVE